MAYLEREDADHDAQKEKDERDDEPDDAPHFEKKRSAVSTCHAGKKRAKISVPCDGKQPQIFAKADASDVLTFRAMVSSVGVTPPMVIRLHCHPISKPKKKTHQSRPKGHRGTT